MSAAPAVARGGLRLWLQQGASAIVRQARQNSTRGVTPRPRLRNGQSSRSHHSRYFVSAGILSMLGLGEEKATDSDEEVDDDEEKLIYNIKLGIHAHNQGDLDKAELLLHIALKMAQDLQNYDGITYVYDMLAQVAMDKGDHMKAERLFKAVVQRLTEKGVEPEDNKIVAISLKLAGIYAGWTRHDDAVKGFQFCVQTQESKVQKGDLEQDTVLLWAMAMDHFAQYLLSLGHYKKALDLFRSAYQTNCKAQGESHSQSIVLLNSMGTVYTFLGDQAKAIEIFESTVSLAREHDEENLPAYLVNLGMANLQKGLTTDAIVSCNEGRQLYRRAEDPEGVERAQDCVNAVKELIANASKATAK